MQRSRRARGHWCCAPGPGHRRGGARRLLKLRRQQQRRSRAKGGTYTFWDPYPQYSASSAWAQLVAKCGTEAGVTVKRTGYDTTALTTQRCSPASRETRRTSC